MASKIGLLIGMENTFPAPFLEAVNDKGKQGNVILPAPPVELIILPKQVANLTVNNANLTAKPGTDSVVLVKVARLFDYAGDFKVQLVLPPGMKGVSAGDITIVPGQDEAKLTLKIAGDAIPGARPNITVRAVAVLHGSVTLTHETKINVNVTK